jgi:hypothetical protein
MRPFLSILIGGVSLALAHSNRRWAALGHVTRARDLTAAGRLASALVEA